MSGGSQACHLAKALERTQQQRQWDRALQSHQSHLHALAGHGGTFRVMGTASHSLQAAPRRAAQTSTPSPRSSASPHPFLMQQHHEESSKEITSVQPGTPRPMTPLSVPQTGTGLGTSAGLLSAPSFGILQHRGRGQDMTRADGTFANAPAKQRIKFSPCQDQTFPVPGQNFPCARPPAQPRDHGRPLHSPSCLQS